MVLPAAANVWFSSKVIVPSSLTRSSIGDCTGIGKSVKVISKVSPGCIQSPVSLLALSGAAGAAVGLPGAVELADAVEAPVKAGIWANLASSVDPFLQPAR